MEKLQTCFLSEVGRIAKGLLESARLHTKDISSVTSFEGLELH